MGDWPQVGRDVLFFFFRSREAEIERSSLIQVQVSYTVI